MANPNPPNPNRPGSNIVVALTTKQSVLFKTKRMKKEASVRTFMWKNNSVCGVVIIVISANPTATY